MDLFLISKGGRGQTYSISKDIKFQVPLGVPQWLHGLNSGIEPGKRKSVTIAKALS
jgi:hypothetical protein